MTFKEFITKSIRKIFLCWSKLIQRDYVAYHRFCGVKIGTDCCIKSWNFGSEPYLISIGNHVQITADVKIFTHGGGWIIRKEDKTFDAFGTVKIGNNVYVANNVLIMPGVTVGDNVLIGAGSVVTKSTPSDVVIAGNPARIVSGIEEYKEKILAYNTHTKLLSEKQKRDVLLGSNCKLFKKPYIKQK